MERTVAWTEYNKTELKKLETDGIITYDPPTIEINDPEALQNVLSK